MVREQKEVCGKFISLDQASELLELAKEWGASMRLGGLSLHHVVCPNIGKSILIQGSNGEFALISVA